MKSNGYWRGSYIAEPSLIRRSGPSWRQTTISRWPRDVVPSPGTMTATLSDVGRLNWRGSRFGLMASWMETVIVQVLRPLFSRFHDDSCVISLPFFFLLMTHAYGKGENNKTC